jgi:hypothetical protein
MKHVCRSVALIKEGVVCWISFSEKDGERGERGVCFSSLFYAISNLWENQIAPSTKEDDRKRVSTQQSSTTSLCADRRCVLTLFCQPPICQKIVEEESEPISTFLSFMGLVVRTEKQGMKEGENKYVSAA